MRVSEMLRFSVLQAVKLARCAKALSIAVQRFLSEVSLYTRGLLLIQGASTANVVTNVLTFLT